MSKLTTKQKSIMLLIQRSPCNKYGWYKISKTVWPIIDGVLPSDLVKIKVDEGGGRLLRLTDNGKVVMKYL
jgi:hypothetical protein